MQRTTGASLREHQVPFQLQRHSQIFGTQKIVESEHMYLRRKARDVHFPSRRSKSEPSCPAVSRKSVEAFLADPSLVGSNDLNRYVVCTTSGSTGTPALLLHDHGALTVYNALGYLRSLPVLFSLHHLWGLLRGGGRKAAEAPQLHPRSGKFRQVWSEVKKHEAEGCTGLTHQQPELCSSFREARKPCRC